jgi:hypothetical protein
MPPTQITTLFALPVVEAIVVFVVFVPPPRSTALGKDGELTKARDVANRKVVNKANKIRCGGEIIRKGEPSPSLCRHTEVRFFKSSSQTGTTDVAVFAVAVSTARRLPKGVLCLLMTVLQCGVC